MLKLIILILSAILFQNMIPWSIIILILIFMALYMLSTLPFSAPMLALSSISMTDNMSTCLISLSIWITSLMLIASFYIHQNRVSAHLFSKTCIGLLLILTITFSSSNLILFYLWFEASLIPITMMIMLWGYQPERVQASMYLMIYTVTASLPLLISILFVLKNFNSILIPTLFFMSSQYFSTIFQFMMVAAFLVKLPLFSVHLWLPKAHVEAPIAGSMVLAAILLKLGGYGLLRIYSTFYFTYSPFITLLTSIAMFGAIATSLMCLRQADLKSLIAYSSVSHMGLLIMGSSTNSKMGLYGCLLMMISHGFSSSAMFCLANLSYETNKTRNLTQTLAILSISPFLSLIWFLIICANMAIPPSVNLLGEIILLLSSINYSLLFTLLFMLTSFFTACYSIYLYSTTNHGSSAPFSNPVTSFHPKNNTLLLSHLYPLFILMIFPAKVTT